MPWDAIPSPNWYFLILKWLNRIKRKSSGRENIFSYPRLDTTEIISVPIYTLEMPVNSNLYSVSFSPSIS